ncbi:MAG: STAS domain-containing protein [Spirochaetia bacterium]|jgi:anti-anti-sigma factor
MSNTDILPGFDEDTCDSLTIELERVEGAAHSLVLKPRGQIDTYSSLFFQRSTRKAIDAGFIDLIFLIGSVDYVSSMGVGAFVQLQKAAREKGGDIALVDVHPKVMEILKLMCLEKFFSCTDSIEEAIAPIRSRESVPTFPKASKCPICEKRLRALRSGRFRCPKCKTVISIDESGAVSFVGG